MKLIGMLDSPYVRRVAISLQLMGLRFEHQSLSVFRNFDAFSRINPVVKAPTLVCDDGGVLMDSTLILDHADSLPGRRRSLMPEAPAERLQALRTIGLALAACEKCVQMLYEHNTRPADKLHAPWLERITGQMAAAYGALEAGLQHRPVLPASDSIDQAGVTTAVAWHFTQSAFPGLLDGALHPALRAFSQQAEQLPEFRAAPHGDGTYAAP